jgi:copper chaperone NosL
MKSINIILSVFALSLLVSCQVEPEPIDYGTDVCHHCKMTIVDKKFAAQAVTEKGKVYNFDAIECLVQFVDERSETKFAFVQTNSYLKPEERLNVKDAFFVKSPEIPSPMGAYLSAYGKREAAKNRADHPEAKIMNWSQLQEEVLTQQ